MAALRAAAEIEVWIIDHLVVHLGVNGTRVRPQTRFFELGLDSLEAVAMAEALERWLGTPVTPTIAWEQPTIAALAGHLAGRHLAPSCGRIEAPANTPPAPRVMNPDAAAEAYRAHVNPDLAALLAQLGLAKHFVRGEGSVLWDDAGRRYLDFVAAYGALPLGHNPPAIWRALRAVEVSGEPNFVQGSTLGAAGELAARILSLTPPGLDRVSFANSGAEAVEAALKMCRMATGRPGILATTRSFHGKTLGAISATGNDRYHDVAGGLVDGFAHVPFGDAAALRAALAARPGHYAAFIIEPIQGEGGIVEPPPGYLAAARAACDAAGVLLIFDEIQTGLGRTGAWFACHHEGVVPDVMTLAKALGGGLVPIGAVVAGPAAHSEDFGLKHSSTFAGGGLACRVGLAALACLAHDNAAIIRQVARYGAALKSGLEKLAGNYPHLISEVRGKGFLLGLRFAVHRRTWRASVLGLAADEGGLAPLFAAYLLCVEGVRLAPTLNGTDVIRIEPPLNATWAECEEVLAALARALAAFSSGDAARVLTSIRAGEARPATKILRPPPRAAARPRPGDGRFAFLFHPLDLCSYADFDPTLAGLAPEALADAVSVIHGLAESALVGEARITSEVGPSAFGEFILIGHTAAELMAMSHARAADIIGRAIDRARDRGALLVGLGAFTSIVTQGGLAVKDRGVALTSGNSFTVASTLDATLGALLAAGNHEPAVAVVGAGGAIGRALALLLAEDVSRLLLVGNPGRSAEHVHTQLLDIAAEACRRVVTRAEQATGTLALRIFAAPNLPAADAPLAAFRELAATLCGPDGPIVLTRDAALAAREADAILTATSATGVLLGAADLRPGAIICEISRPRNLGPELRTQRPDVRVIDGGVIAIPGQPDLGNFGLPRGRAYACMAETMLLALEQRYSSTSLGGALDLAEIDAMRARARTHGFRVVATDL